jgi:hypothetical protein
MVRAYALRPCQDLRAEVLMNLLGKPSTGYFSFCLMIAHKSGFPALAFTGYSRHSMQHQKKLHLFPTTFQEDTPLSLTENEIHSQSS